MLVQDTLTGALHQVPEDSMYGFADEEVMYDGYGNPMGFPPLIPILSSLAPMVLPPLMKAVSSAFKGPEGYGYADDYLMDGWPGYGDGFEDDILLDGYDGYGYGGYAEMPIEGQVVYDGFGNPVGFAPIIGALSKIVPSVASAASRIIPGVARTAARALPGVVRSAARAIPGVVRSILPGGGRRPRFPVPMRPRYPYRPPVRTMPPGWRRPALPYTGLRPKRMYMRCATWPGPAGLVPIHPGTATATTPTPAAPVVRRRRRRRRRRR